MSKKITGSEYPLSKIFTSDFEYHIPSYQRPYAWTEEEANILFDDLYDFFETEKDENYFLGSIVLVKEDDKPYADVIDGQQRLTTLTILLSVIASKFTDKLRETLSKYICEPGNEFEGLKPCPRLYLREKDKMFFEDHIQSLRIKETITKDVETVENESQAHIVLNCKTLYNKVESTFGDNNESLKTFVQFLLQRCYLIAVSTPSQSSAFRVFSVMNSRGLDLLPIDIIKADVIGKIANEKREMYTDKWENLEEETSRTGFNELFAHIRMIFSKQKAKKSILEEFAQFVWPNVKNEVDFIDHIVEPYCNAYNILRGCCYKSTTNADAINSLLKWLNKVDNFDWIPCSIKFFAKHEKESDYILWFVQKLERLASNLLVTSKDVNARIRRYGALLEEMENRNDDSLDNPLSSVELTQEEINSELNVLNGDIYNLPSRRRNFIILRLDSFVSDGAASYDAKILTIEHVLPQTIDERTEWQSMWSKEDVVFWRNKIANLVPLTRRINSSAQNYNFDVKKSKYFTNNDKTSSYALTTQVLSQSTWSVDVVESRQKYLLDTFRKNWDLY